MPKRIWELNAPIDTERNSDGSWTGRLVLDGIDIELRADSHEAAQDAVLSALLEALRARPDEGRPWMEANSTLMPADYVPECFVEPSEAEPIAEVV